MDSAEKPLNVSWGTHGNWFALFIYLFIYFS
jgi:hypothetical protein